MDYNMLIVFCLLKAALTESGSPFAPRDLKCVFYPDTNVTCQWTPSLQAPSDTQYTLHVNMSGRISKFCHSFQPKCSVPMISLHRIYCIQVSAHSDHHPNVSSDMLCLNGTDAVKLHEPRQFSLFKVSGRPRCLRLNWTSQVVRDSDLFYQLQYSTADQTAVILDVDLTEKVQCIFSPCSQYSVKMRFRYKHTLSPWSDWSLPATQSTDTEAPSSPPQLWRKVQAADDRGFRRVTLLWKMRRGTCVDVTYNVQCRVEGSQSGLDLGTCTNLRLSSNFCHLMIPSNTSICTVTMSNSGGSTPPANITIPSQWQTDQRSVVMVNVTSLDDFSLKVGWTALDIPTVTGFVVEWCVTAETDQCQSDLYWQRVERNTFSTIITDGVEPKLRYSISVKDVCGNMSSPGFKVEAYSRQAAPSAGPRLQVIGHGCEHVILIWTPVPMSHRNGFITSYTLHYQSKDNSTTQPCTSIQTAVMSGCVFIAAVSVILCIGWRMRQRIKHNIWPKVPNPAVKSFQDWL
ncbi:interleukin-31 receptor subunit alpha-like isoform X2 [Hoplias malabaricus]|uniref:interleukin-31 receptor subunit alpha-like isoform X2 n=1 Tax=Hoplias malabaricus TaxID=27720 RepID=UPI003461A912